VPSVRLARARCPGHTLDNPARTEAIDIVWSMWSMWSVWLVATGVALLL